MKEERMKQRTPADVAREVLEDLLKQHEKNDAALEGMVAAGIAGSRTIAQRIKTAVLVKATIPGGFRKELRLLDQIDAALEAASVTDPITADLIRLRYVEGLPWPEVEEILRIWPEERAQLEEQGMDRLGRILMITN